jgi:hypothetical protein
MDMVKVSKHLYVVGYKARYARMADLLEGHSHNGYSLESFTTKEAAQDYIYRHFPAEPIAYCDMSLSTFPISEDVRQHLITLLKRWALTVGQSSNDPDVFADNSLQLTEIQDLVRELGGTP